MNNTELLKIAEKHLGEGGAKARAYCGLKSGDAWCNAFVCYIANEGGVKNLYFNGQKYTYCPTSMKWCQANLAMIPPYMALPMDIIYFDWDANNVPNHIGFVRERKSATEILTVEGNVSNKVQNKTRSASYVLGVFRPHFKPSGLKEGLLEVDGLFGYQSIFMLQKVLGIEADGILGQGTVKALQKKVGVAQDGLWGKSTSKAVQKLVGVKVDGYFGADSVKGLQKWINAQYKPTPSKKKYDGALPTLEVKTTNNDKLIKKMKAWAKKYADDDSYKYRKWSESNKYTHQCPLCHPESNEHATKGWNCRGAVAAIFFHGGNVKIACSCSGFGLLGKSLKDFTLANWKKVNGNDWIRIYNKGNNLKTSQLKDGDVIWYFNSDGSVKHVAFAYDIANGKVFDATSSNGLKIRKPSAYGKVAFRYTGGMETVISTVSLCKDDSRHDEVKKMQNFLIWAGYSVGEEGADGFFGSDSEAGVRAFEKDNGLTVDGLWGSACNDKAKEIER